MKKIVIIVLAIIILAILALLGFFKSDASNPYEDHKWGRFSGTCETTDSPGDDFGKQFASCDYEVPPEEIPTFKEVDFPFKNIFDNTVSLPVMASAMIDVDNDGIDEVFVSGGHTQQDALFQYNDGTFVNITNEYGLPKKPKTGTTTGASSFDLDNNGFTDLIVSGDYGVYWYKNNGESFESEKIDITLNEKSSPLTTTIGDFNKDGYPDIFLCTYLFVDKMEGQTIFKDSNYGALSVLLQNNGDNTFTDVTKEMGLEYIHNTFQAVFVDIDNDNYLDLVVAYDTGEARTYRNNTGNGFTMMPNPLTGKYAYPMGIAVGDYNNDGLVDFFFSNTGSSVPEFLAKGDLEETDEFNRDWILFRNDGNFQFTDVAGPTKVANFEFSWGAIFTDFNLDGLQDLVVAENYVDFPPHKLFKLPCRFLIQRSDGTFSAVEDQAGVINKNYAITPLTSDFNLDGYPDLVYVNLNGNVKAFINKGGERNYIAIRFPENNKFIGSRVQVSIDEKTFLSDVYVIGEGLGSDQTSTLHFGLGDKTSVEKIQIIFPSGKESSINNPEINKVHLIETE